MRTYACVLFVSLCLGLCGCGLASKESELRSEKAQTAEEKADIALQGTPVPYRITIKVEGDNAELKKLMEGASALVVLAKKPPDSVFGIERRAKTDVATAVKVLQAQCYYDGTAIYSIDEKAVPVAVVLTLRPGTRYTVGQASIRYDPKPVIPPSFTKRVRSYGLLGLDREELPGPEFPTAIPGIQPGKPVTAETMLDAVAKVPEKLHRKGYPLAKVTESLYTLDRDSRQLNALITIHPGPCAYFGDVRVHGNSGVNASHIQDRKLWKVGKDPWDSDILEEYGNTLRHSGLFRSVVTSPQVDAITYDEASGIATLPVDVTVKEAPFRTVSGNLFYDTSTGFGAQAGWEHRNLFHNGEKFSATGTVATLEQGMKFTFEKPTFFDREQKLSAQASFKHEYTDAYERTGANADIGIERRLTRTLWGGIGFFGDGGILEDTDHSQQQYSAFGPTFSLRHDSRDNTMNPTRGQVISVHAKPFMGSYTETFTALGTTVGGSFFYAPFRDNDGAKSDKLVLATHLEGGSLVGPKLSTLPTSMRYFTGGAGSVRGYTYQAIGPRDRKEEPKGGRSYQLVNLEARYKITDTLGIVPFIDGGMVYTDPLPQIIGDMRWGGGLGFRYFTPIGPLRLDVATPFNPIEGDPPVQLYISIGQSF
ncbi:MAG: BamA/TamA family outer membrane protein [Desulfovibrio sp.]|nr:BamA/TamA family outer membrane protein [Desulfovibrio sp.]